MNPVFSLVENPQNAGNQPIRNQDSFSPTLWFIWAQFWNQWTKCSWDQLKFWVLPIFYPCGAMGQPWLLFSSKVAPLSQPLSDVNFQKFSSFFQISGSTVRDETGSDKIRVRHLLWHGLPWKHLGGPPRLGCKKCFALRGWAGKGRWFRPCFIRWGYGWRGKLPIKWTAPEVGYIFY